MNLDYQALPGWRLSALLAVLLLSACAPAPGGSSPALRQQLETIRQQQQQQAEQLNSLQERFNQLQAQLSPPSATGQRVSPPAQIPRTGDRKKVPAYVQTELSDLADSASTYLAAFSDLAAGRYAAAEAGFDLFLREYPEHQYSPNARYWLASAQSAQGNLQAAMANLRQIVVADNGQAKAPAALAQLAQLYRQQGLEMEANDILEQLRSRYPDSPEAQHFYQSDNPQQ